MPQALQQLELCSRLCGRPSTHSPCNWEIAPSAHYPGREDPLEQRQAPHSSILRLPSGSAGKESACGARGLGSVPGLGRSLKEKATHSSIPGLPWWLSWERIRLQCRRPRFNPGLGRSPGEGKGPPLQCSGLESTCCIVPGVAKSQTRLSDFHCHQNAPEVTGHCPS